MHLMAHPNRRAPGPARGRLLRAVAFLTLIALGTAALAPAARARELMLDSPAEPSEGTLTAYGWTFTTLTLVALGYGVLAYSESQDEQDEADKNYDQYQAADTTADALYYRQRVERHQDKAQSAETRANIAIALTLVFALTAFYSFSPDSAPNLSVTANLNGPMLVWRF